MSDSWSPLRVQRLALSQFKAYLGTSEHPVTIDLDNADIVLVVGANGRGKTSIVEALELALTGTYQARVGKEKLDWKKSTPFDDLIHQSGEPLGSAARCATIQVAWSSTDNVSLGMEKVEILPGRVNAAGLWSARRERPGVDLTRVRATTLFYAEALSGLLGGDPDARRMTFDAFVGELPDVKLLAAQIGDRLVPLIEFAKSQVDAARGDVTIATNAAAAAADALTHMWAEVSDVTISLVKARGEWSEPNLKKGLKQMGAMLEVEVTEADPNNLFALQRAADHRAAKDREAQIEAATKGGAVSQAWTRVRHALADYVRASPEQWPSDVPDQDLNAVERGLDEIQREIEEGARRVDSLKEQLAQIWSTVELEGPDGRQRASAGTLPLLLLLARPEGATVAGALGLGVPEPDALAAQSAHERKRYETLRGALNQELGLLRDETARHRELNAQRERLRARKSLLEVWANAAPDECIPKDGAEGLDLEQIRARAVSQVGPQVDLPDWSRVAGALGRLGEALRTLREAEATVHDPVAGERALRELTRLADLASSLAATDKRGLYPSVRARLVSERYHGKFNEATRAVLAAYDHHERVGQGLRVEFNSEGAIQVRVESHPQDGTGSSSATGALSLSRSQLISVSFALAIAANLGQEQSPVGFICLDDIADALDVDNLAAEATLLRRLAYSQNPHARRQLIITSHNRELTDRLVPLLLPPPGRKMRIVEVAERRNGGRSEVHPEVFEVQPDVEAAWRGRSRLREILPAR